MPINKGKQPVSLFPAAGPFPETRRDVPPGKLEMIINYLEMTRVPKTTIRSRRAEALAILRCYRPTLSFYRYLYNTVGEMWNWYERRVMDDASLEEIIANDEVEIYVLYLNGVPAGYSELDRRIPEHVELAYFGLIPDFIGRGLGSYFLNWSVQTAWREDTQRVWVHTCNFDHPRALATYQKAGFRVYHQEQRLIDNQVSD